VKSPSAFHKGTAVTVHTGMWGVNVQPQSFLTSAPNRGHRSAALSLREKLPSTL